MVCTSNHGDEPGLSRRAAGVSSLKCAQKIHSLNRTDVAMSLDAQLFATMNYYPQFEADAMSSITSPFGAIDSAALDPSFGGALCGGPVGSAHWQCALSRSLVTECAARIDCVVACTTTLSCPSVFSVITYLVWSPLGRTCLRIVEGLAVTLQSSSLT